MKYLMLPLAAALTLAGGCASSSGTPADASAEKARASSTRTAGLDPTSDNVRCERFKPVGSNLTERRCYVVGSEDEAARQAREREMRRRMGGG